MVSTELLRRYPFFAGLNDDQLRELAMITEKLEVQEGDTLFAGSIGRTDFQGGDYDSLINSVINKIFPLGDDLRVYPGHGPASTIGQERKFNPFFRA